MLISLRRLIIAGATNFWRNIWLSAAASLIMVITLAILTTTLLLFNLASVAISNVQERVDISVYFKSNVSEQQILAVKSSIESFPEVAHVNYISAATALEIFKQKHANDPLITESLDELGENPLPPALQVKARELNQYQEIVRELDKDEYKTYISKVNFDDNRAIIERLSAILGAITKFGIGLVVIFTAIAIMVIFNTIRLTINNRREEVEIMRLVGATNWYIRGPFIIEAVIYALTATVITTLLLIPVFQYVIPRLNIYLGAAPGQSFSAFSLGYLFLLQLAVALILGILCSFLAIRRYLKV